MPKLNYVIIAIFVFGLTANATSPAQGINNFHQVDDHV